MNNTRLTEKHRFVHAVPLPSPEPVVPPNELQATLKDLVDAFSVQDIGRIMSHFAADAEFADVIGRGQRGTVSRGKEAIEAVFQQQFELLGPHTYENSVTAVEGNTGFAAWTLVLCPDHPRRIKKFDGIDRFLFRGDGKVILKQAWIKDHGRLWRTVLGRGLHLSIGKLARYSRYR